MLHSETRSFTPLVFQTISPNIVEAIPMDDKLSAITYAKKPKGTPAGDPITQRVSVDSEMFVAQRPFHPKNVRDFIVKTDGRLDWNLFGFVTAVKLKDGTTKIVNGQHRISLVKTLDPTITEVPAHIIHEDDPEYIAKLFGYMNGGASRPVTREERLWAEIIANDPTALKTAYWLKKCKLACGMVNQYDDKGRPTDWIQVNVAGFEKCLKHSETATEMAVDLIKKAFPKQKKNIDQQLLGLVVFLTTNEYRDILTPTKVISSRFIEFFTKDLPKIMKFEALKFKVYRNTSKWEVGIAYGIAKKFRHWLEVNDYPLIGLQTIKKQYIDGIGEPVVEDDEDSDE